MLLVTGTGSGNTLNAEGLHAVGGGAGVAAQGRTVERLDEGFCADVVAGIAANCGIAVAAHQSLHQLIDALGILDVVVDGVVVEAGLPAAEEVGAVGEILASNIDSALTGIRGDGLRQFHGVALAVSPAGEAPAGDVGGIQIGCAGQLGTIGASDLGRADARVVPVVDMVEHGVAFTLHEDVTGAGAVALDRNIAEDAAAVIGGELGIVQCESVHDTQVCAGMHHDSGSREIGIGGAGMDRRLVQFVCAGARHGLNVVIEGVGGVVAGFKNGGDVDIAVGHGIAFQIVQIGQQRAVFHTLQGIVHVVPAQEVIACTLHDRDLNTGDDLTFNKAVFLHRSIPGICNVPVLIRMVVGRTESDKMAGPGLLPGQVNGDGNGSDGEQGVAAGVGHADLTGLQDGVLRSIHGDGAVGSVVVEIGIGQRHLEILVVQILLSKCAGLDHKGIHLQQIVADLVGCVVPHLGGVGPLCGLKDPWLALLVQDVPCDIQDVDIHRQDIHEYAQMEVQIQEDAVVGLQGTDTTGALGDLAVLHTQVGEEDAVHIDGIAEVYGDSRCRQGMFLGTHRKQGHRNADTGSDPQTDVAHEVQIQLRVGRLQVHGIGVVTGLEIHDVDPCVELIASDAQGLHGKTDGNAHLGADDQFQIDGQLTDLVGQSDLDGGTGAADGQDLHIVDLFFQQILVDCDQGLLTVAQGKGGLVGHHLADLPCDAVHIGEAGIVVGIQLPDGLLPGEGGIKILGGDDREGCANAHIGTDVHTGHDLIFLGIGDAQNGTLDLLEAGPGGEGDLLHEAGGHLQAHAVRPAGANHIVADLHGEGQTQLQTHALGHGSDLLQVQRALDMDIDLADFHHQGAHTGLNGTGLDGEAGILADLGVPLAALVPGVVALGADDDNIVQGVAVQDFLQLLAAQQGVHQIFGCLICKAALDGLLLCLGFQLGDGLGGDAQIVGVHIVQRSGLHLIPLNHGEDGDLAVLIMADPHDLVVAVAGGVIDNAGIQGQVVTDFGDSLAVHVQLRILGKDREIQILVVNGNRAVLVEEGAVHFLGLRIVHGNRQRLGRKQDLLDTGQGIGIDAAVDLGDLHIGDFAIHIAVLLIENAVVNCDHIANAQGVAVISKGIGLVVDLHAVLTHVVEQDVCQNNVGDLIEGQEDHRLVDAHVIVLFDGNDDVVILDLRIHDLAAGDKQDHIRLHQVALVIEGGGLVTVDGGHLIGTAGHQAAHGLQGENAVALVHDVIVDLAVLVGEGLEAQAVSHLLCALCLDLQGEIGSHILGGDVVQSVAGPLLLLDVIAGDHHGIEGHICGHNRIVGDQLRQIGIAEPAAEDIVVPLGQGQLIDLGICFHQDAVLHLLRGIVRVGRSAEGDLVVAGDAALLLQILVELCADLGGLATGGRIFGAEALVGVALHQTQRKAHFHRFLRIVCDLVCITIGKRLAFYLFARQVQEVQQEGGDLLTGGVGMGIKHIVAHAVGNTLLGCPGNIGAVPGIGVHVRKDGLGVRIRIHLGQSAEYGHEHGTGQGILRRKRCGGCAVENAVLPHIGDIVAVPIPGSHIRKRMRSPVIAFGGEDGCGDHTQEDGYDQNKTDDPFHNGNLQKE